MFYWYDPISNPSLPSQEAFPAGPYVDGSTSYMGLGKTSYLGISDCPARLSTKATSPGAFIATSNGEERDVNDAYYKANHPATFWIKATEFTVFENPRTVWFLQGNFAVALARVNVSGVTYVGRVN